jgi:Tfp pilus assembly protein PilF
VVFKGHSLAIGVVGVISLVIVFALVALDPFGSGEQEETEGGAASGPGVVSATPAVTAKTPTPTPTQDPLALLDRSDCVQIRGSEFRSAAERDWYLANCPTVTPSATSVPPSPTTLSQPAPTPVPTIDPAAVEHFQRGLDLRVAGKPGEALVELDAAIALSPIYDAAYYQRGLAYLGLGKCLNAIADFDQLIVLNPTYVSAHWQRGWVMLGLEMPQQAIASLDVAIKLSPTSYAFYFNRAIAYARLGNIEQALRDMQQAQVLTTDASVAASFQGFIETIEGPGPYTSFTNLGPNC